MSTTAAPPGPDRDTPPRPRSARTASFRNDTLEDMRKAVKDDVMYKTEVSLDDFIKRFLPEFPENIKITDVCQRMEGLKAWEKLSSPPSTNTSTEDVIFKQLTRLFDEMVKAAQFAWEKMNPGSCPKNRWSLITDPTVAPKTRGRSSTIKPDAIFHRRPEGSDSRPYLYDNIALTAEFKKHGGTANSLDNISKVVNAMKHIMAVDARRRFTFSITIENTTMGLWYANRSMLVGSKPLDVVKNKETLLKVLLSFAFATDLDMGWDPSVRLLEGVDSYHIDVGDIEYQTVEVLQDHGTDVILSRGARIFSVKKVGDTDDKVYVLKDIWLEKDRKPEHEIYEDIIKDVGDQYSETGSTLGVKEDTETIMMRSRALESAENILLPILSPSNNPARNSKTFSSPSDMEVDTNDDSRDNVRDPEKTRHRLHYRVVFKEFAEPIYKVKTMGDVFIVLADMIEVFRLLHGSGWVHRDISVGNVYLYEARGMLGDLEFAKSTADDSQREVRTGTVDFMPAEVIRLEYLFRPTTDPSYEDEVDEQATEVQQLPFRYNAIHDIESVWWIGAYMLFFYRPKGHDESSDESRKRQFEAAEIFPGTLRFSSKRFIYLAYSEEFLESTREWISKKSMFALHALNILRKVLLKLYRELEGTFLDGVSRLSAKADRRDTGEAFPGGPKRDIYTPIHRMLMKVKAKCDDDNIELQEFKVSGDANKSKKTRSSVKRRRDVGAAEVGEGSGRRRRD